MAQIEVDDEVAGHLLIRRYRLGPGATLSDALREILDEHDPQPKLPFGKAEK